MIPVIAGALLRRLQAAILLLQFVHAERLLDRPGENSGSNGFVQKSWAPSAIARSALAPSFCPVSTITFVFGASE
jgi:hypothetical protein